MCRALQRACVTGCVTGAGEGVRRRAAGASPGHMLRMGRSGFRPTSSLVFSQVTQEPHGAGRALAPWGGRGLSSAALRVRGTRWHLWSRTQNLLP